MGNWVRTLKKVRMNILKKVFSKNKETKAPYEALLKGAMGPIMKIVLGEHHLATLFYDGNRYCLIYHTEFLNSGLAPFNPEQLDKSAFPVIDKCYYSENLWHVFSSRIPSKERSDFEILMKKIGLSGNENPLEILSKIGSVSISKPWKLELLK